MAVEDLVVVIPAQDDSEWACSGTVVETGREICGAVVEGSKWKVAASVTVKRIDKAVMTEDSGYREGIAVNMPVLCSACTAHSVVQASLHSRSKSDSSDHKPVKDWRSWMHPLAAHRRKLENKGRAALADIVLAE